MRGMKAAHPCGGLSRPASGKIGRAELLQCWPRRTRPAYPQRRAKTHLRTRAASGSTSSMPHLTRPRQSARRQKLSSAPLGLNKLRRAAGAATPPRYLLIPYSRARPEEVGKHTAAPAVAHSIRRRPPQHPPPPTAASAAPRRHRLPQPLWSRRSRSSRISDPRSRLSHSSHNHSNPHARARATGRPGKQRATRTRT